MENNPGNNYKIIVTDEKGKDEEMKRAIDLLKDKSSDRLTVLEDLLELLRSSLRINNYLLGKYLELGFLSSSIKIFEDEIDGNEKIISVIVEIVNYLGSFSYGVRKKDSYKPIDAVNSLYNIMINRHENEIKEDAVKVIVIIAKKYPSDVMSYDGIKNKYKIILPSVIKNTKEKRKISFILFKELIKEGVIKKGGFGSDIIEELLFIFEELEKRKNSIDTSNCFSNANREFVKFAKEKGFEEKVHENENIIMGDLIFVDWEELCKENQGSNENNDGIIKEEEEGKIRNFCDYVINHPFDSQIKFFKKLITFSCESKKSSVFYKCFASRKNGQFLHLYLPMFFRIYHFENVLLNFFIFVKQKFIYYHRFYDYIILLRDEIIEKFMKEQKEEIEINDENIIKVAFCWSVLKEGEKKTEGVNCLVEITAKIFEWMGRIEEGKNLDKEYEKEGEENEKEMKEVVNKKEMIFMELLDKAGENLFFYTKELKDSIMEDGRISRILLEVAKNHIKNGKSLIQEGNKRRIIEYVIYSYYEFIDISNLLSLSSPSFPFSSRNILSIIRNIVLFISVEGFKDLEKDVLYYYLECIILSLSIINIVNDYYSKKEKERDKNLELDDDKIDDLKRKISFYWSSSNSFLISRLCSVGLCSMDNESNYIFRKLINLHFIHIDDIYSYESENENVNDKEKTDKNDEEIIKFRPFVINQNCREEFFNDFFVQIPSKDYYSIIDLQYFMRRTEEECSFVSMLMKDLSGELVDRIEKREGINVRKERRKYERETADKVFKGILQSFKDLLHYTFKDRNNIYLGRYRNKDIYKEKEKEIKEDRDYISDILAEEDLKECLILFLRYIEEFRNYNNNRIMFRLSFVSNNAKDSLLYL